MIASLAFRYYVTNFGSYNETYGAIGGVMVLLLWFYVSGIALLVGAEVNAEIEHASPYGKEVGERVPGEKKKIGPAAARAYSERRKEGGTAVGALSRRHQLRPGPAGTTPRECAGERPLDRDRRASSSGAEDRARNEEGSAEAQREEPRRLRAATSAQLGGVARSAGQGRLAPGLGRPAGLPERDVGALGRFHRW